MQKQIMTTRRFKFSLKTIFAAMTLVALVSHLWPPLYAQYGQWRFEREIMRVIVGDSNQETIAEHRICCR